MALKSLTAAACSLIIAHERIGSVRCDSVPFLLLVDGDDGRYRQRRLPRCQRSLLDTPCAVTGDLKPIILEGRYGYTPTIAAAPVRVRTPRGPSGNRAYRFQNCARSGQAKTFVVLVALTGSFTIMLAHPLDAGAGPMPLPMCALRIDWTLLRLFPPLRPLRAGRQGTQAVMPISGANAKRVLFGAIGLRPFGIRRQAGQSDAQAFLRELRPALSPRRPAPAAGRSGERAHRSSDAGPGRPAAHPLPVAAKTGLRTEPDGPALARAQAAHRRQSPSRVIDELAADAAGWVLALTAQKEGRKSRYGIQTVRAQKPVARLLATYSAVQGRRPMKTEGLGVYNCLRRLCLASALTAGLAMTAGGSSGAAQTVVDPDAIAGNPEAVSQLSPFDTTVAYVAQFYPLWFTYYQSQLASSTRNQLVGPDRISPIYHYVVAINVDTLYASSYLDLTAEPVILTIPGNTPPFPFTSYSILMLDPTAISSPTARASEETGKLCPDRTRGFTGTLPTEVTSSIMLPVNFSALIFRADKFSQMARSDQRSRRVPQVTQGSDP
jgi:hypothetical protein